MDAYQRTGARGKWHGERELDKRDTQRRNGPRRRMVQNEIVAGQVSVMYTRQQGGVRGQPASKRFA